MFNLIGASMSVLVWGRATGKTDGPSADFLLNNVHKMPRGNQGIYCNTFTSTLTNVLPGVIRGWSRYGYIQDLHFWVRKYAPKEFKVPKAYRYPLIPEHYIQWYNGSGIYLLSGDRALANGLELDAAVIEEARLQNRDKLREFLLCIRGNDEHFGHLSNHGSLLFVTDMPQNSKEKWILDYREEMDDEDIQIILAIQIKLRELKQKLQEAAPSTIKKIQTKINYFEDHLTKIRKETVYFSTASTLQNVHALGLNPIMAYKRNLSDIEFSISVLNEEIEKIENGFYGMLDSDQHEYTAENYTYIDKLQNPELIERDCRWQNDISSLEPLHIAFDHNQVINNVVTGQPQGRQFLTLNHLHVLGENNEFLSDLCKKWCRYHAYHRNKTVFYYYDNTSVGGDASGNVPFFQEVVDILTKEGWMVRAEYIGQASSHHSRHYLWELGLMGNDQRIQVPMFNSVTCPWLLKSMKLAPVKKIGEFYKKDKSAEKPNKFGKYQVDQREAPHASEAMDTLYFATQRQKIDSGPGLTDNIYS